MAIFNWPVKDSAKNVVFTIDAGDMALTTGLKKPLIIIPSNRTFKSWSITADKPGVIAVDIWRTTSTTVDPTIMDSILNSHYIALTGQQTLLNQSVLSWETATLNRWDIIGFYINAFPEPTVNKISILLEG